MGKKRSDSVVYGFLALTTMLWGSQYIANKVLMEAVPSFTLLSLQLILSAIVLAAIQLVRRPEKIEKPRRIAKGDRKYVLLLGLGGYVLSVGLQQLGTKLAGASLASLINCMNPVAICFFAVVLLHERMTAKKVVCIASAVAGAVCIVGGNLGGATWPVSCFRSALCWPGVRSAWSCARLHRGTTRLPLRLTASALRRQRPCR